MTGERVPVHMLVRPRTLLASVVGFAAAAFVTSFAAVTAQSGAFDAAVRAALIGGVALLVSCVVSTGYALRRISGTWERRTWGAIFTAELLITGGALLRAGSFLHAWGGPSGEAGEGVYTAGLLVLMAAAVAQPFRRARPAELAVPLAGSLAGAAALGTVFWVLAGSRMMQAAHARHAPMEPGRLWAFMTLMLFMAAVVWFTTLSAVAIRSFPEAVPLSLVSGGLACVLAGDLSWLYRMVHIGWGPGTFGDFIHLAGHVLVASGALVAADIATGAERLMR